MPKILILNLFLVITSLTPIKSMAQECPKVQLSDFPAKDLPADFNPTLINNNPSYKHYYGIGVPVNYKKARQLAFIEMKVHADSEQGPFDGAAILIMLYANGFGVKRNLDLCIRLACANIDGAIAENEFRVSHLKQMKLHPSKDTFDICDDITSGYMMGFCESLYSEKEDLIRDASFKAVLKSWPKKHKEAYKKLKEVADSYFHERVSSEVDVSGTARAMFTIREADLLADTFLLHIKQANKSSIANVPDEDFNLADKELNKVYSIVMNAKEFLYGTVTQEGIRNAQRKWILYRDAWVSFAKVRCPQLTETTWKTLLTIERTRQLRYFTEDIEN